jgi:adenosyl cobinamide kinase/adenosyl cobinamide phosphate guanylyltransferase
VNELARRYRDVLGRVNVAFADVATEAYLVVAGKALALVEPSPA